MVTDLWKRRNQIEKEKGERTLIARDVILALSFEIKKKLSSMLQKRLNIEVLGTYKYSLMHLIRKKLNPDFVR